MSKKSKSKRDQRKRGQHANPYDHRRGDAVTVAWVISAIACGLAGAIGGVGVYLMRNLETADKPSFWETLSPLMLFIAAITGLIVICLTPLVYIFRRTPPPIAVTVVALAVAISPLVALVVMAS